MENESICCPKFDPSGWDEKEFIWNNKSFIKAKVKTFLYMPIGFGGAMVRLNQQIEEAKAEIPDYLCLSEHTSKWNMNLYLATNKEITGADNVEMSGNYVSKVYEGPFQDTGKWMQDFDKYLHEIGKESKKSYMWYTTCPKCAKKYGKNYVVVIAEV